MHELGIKFYLGQNEDGIPGDRTSDNSERLLQRGSGRRSVYKILVRGKFSAFKPFGCYSVTKSSLSFCDPMDCSIPAFPVLNRLLEFAPTHVHRFGDVIQPLHLCHPILLLPSIFPSIGVLYIKLAIHIMWPKCWSFSFNISPYSEYEYSLKYEFSGLIFFRIDWFDLLAVQGTLKKSSPTPQFKGSILWCSAFFMV